MTLHTEAEYLAALRLFDALIDADSANNAALLPLQDAIHAYEKAQDFHPGIPQTIAGRIEIEMFRRRLKQKELAALLEITPSRLNEVLKGKRQINLDLARRLYQKLQIPADFILDAA
ncbi:helix-turn-helix domain-containing protein [Hymenobacter jeollabukensis]|uniref:Helix-turn-helix domain-containing protein n=1 Tax=Hymenobacter jeollabukensis TaxID=2025313 RepID=A0A5R8WIP9_9BACT|nr:helix-turn-helix domain-containing protein [Hymenobacter jeollabukensis]TLM88655.1 helix-turn-helix domain-containing protein [Hymenobacter jeollabukensis]